MLAFPDYSQLDITQYPRLEGFYTLGMLAAHLEPECAILPFVHPDHRSPDLYPDLCLQIDQALDAGKKVLVVLWDEGVAPDPVLGDIFNRYSEDPVWIVTQLGSQDQLFYRFQHNLKCRLIELPWWQLNDCLTYYRVADRTDNQPTDSPHNFNCLVARIEQHKLDLLQALEDRKLSQHGVCNMAYPQASMLSDQITASNHPPYPYTKNPSRDNPRTPTVAYRQVGPVWISANVENFFRIQQHYNTPLAIVPETSVGIFFSTEKSIWPTLLGQLCLIYGRVGVMRHLQRFSSLDQSLYADLTFDSMEGYTREQCLARLHVMLDRNRDLIRNARDIYHQYAKEINAARWCLGQNLYEFVVSQLATVID